MAHGSFTLVLTDVVGSTKLAAELGDTRNASLWQAHDRRTRDLVGAWNGRELQRTDGVLVLFDEATSALRFARDYLDALSELDPPMQARVAVHDGSLATWPNAPADVARGARPEEAEGLALAVAARLLALAPGGRILLTATTLPDPLPRDVGAVTDRGYWRFKGTPDPIEVLEVHHGSLTPPPLEDVEKAFRVRYRRGEWLPVREVPHALPAEWDPFVGRAAVLADLSRHIDEGARLITLLGPGGSGKTRTATRFAWRHLGDFEGGVWFCDLSEARDEHRIAYAVATAMSLPHSALGPELSTALATRGHCLVVLDNFEQVVHHANKTVLTWLAAAPKASFVVTSREVLGLPGETVVVLGPLDQTDAVKLFATRAAAVTGGMFSVGGANADDVDALVQQLDRIPLAIELCAARARMASARELRKRMSDRFRLLTGGHRVPRQTTLQATFDWSWDLLSADEQRGFAQLSVFEGSFELAVAEAVLDLGDAWPMDVVQSLVDKSLVRRIENGRLGLLTSARDYAARRLQPTDEALVRARHGNHFAGMGTDTALEAVAGPDGPELLRAITAELDNLVAACRYGIEQQDAEIAVPCLRAATLTLQARGHFGLVASLAAEVAEMPNLPPARSAAVRVVQGHAAMGMELLHTALDHYSAALAHHEATSNVLGCGQMLNNIGDLHRALGDFDAASTFLGKARNAFASIGRRDLQATVLGNLGRLTFMTGATADALSLFREALEIHRQAGDKRREGLLLGNVGFLQLLLGQYPQARTTLEQALETHRALGAWELEALALSHLGTLAADEGDAAEAERCFTQGLEITARADVPATEGQLLGGLGDLRRRQGRTDDARDLYERALTTLEGREADAHVAKVEGGLGNLYQDLGDLGQAERHYTRALTLNRNAGNTRGEAFNLACLGTVSARRGQPGTATEHWDEAIRLLRDEPDPLGLAQVLAERATHEHAWDPVRAAAHLEEAEQLAGTLDVPPTGTLGTQIIEARATRAATRSIR